MTCEEIKELLSAYADGELVSQEKLLVQVHVSSCENCSRLAGELKSLKLALSRVPQKELPDMFMASLKQKMLPAGWLVPVPGASVSAGAGKRSYLLDAAWKWAFPLVASAALFLLAASFALQSKVNVQPDPDQFFLKAHAHAALKNPLGEPVSVMYSGLSDVAWFPQESE